MTIKELREKAGMTQAQLAEKSGVHLMQISKLERGVSKPENMTLSTAAAIAAALKVHAEDLLL